MSDSPIRVGLVGAGYIAPWHAGAVNKLPNARVVAVCDTSIGAARKLAESIGASAYASLESMLQEARCDAVHILSPPHLHKDQAIVALRSGAHVFVEKPFALSAADCQVVCDAARTADRMISVNHNFLGLGSYNRLKSLVKEGSLGRIDSIDLHWLYPLPPLRSGPFGSWMLRQPGNLLLELGPHLYAFVVDLFGQLENIQVVVEKPIVIPGGIEHFQSWKVLAQAGGVSVTIHVSLVEGVDDRSVSLRGVAGSARLDFASDTLIVHRSNNADIIVNPLLSAWGTGWQYIREGTRNAWRQSRSLNRESPYALSFQSAVRTFYGAISDRGATDSRFSGESATAVIDGIERTLAKASIPAVPTVSARPELPGPCTVLVTGGTGFIGRYLVRALVDSGRKVRVLSRGSFNPFPELGANIELCSASPRDTDAMRSALTGIDTVYHLARADEATWEGYLQNDVGVAEAVGRAALAAGVRRFIYCGTIASYDASVPGRPISESTTFGDMSRRNLYARSKAMCEERLTRLYRDEGLPLVIARPGIVVGAGGPLQHWGIGRWNGAGAVKIWGSGDNILPFVLVEDVADGLVLMADADGIEGQSFNLIGEPMLTAKSYFNAICETSQTRIQVDTGNLFKFYVMDLMKFAIKRTLLGRETVTLPTLSDWRSRAHLSPFLNEQSKSVLGWKPESDRGRFIERAIGGTHLFGY